MGEGYATRQFYDVAENITFKPNMKSPDKYGVLLKKKDANGRHILKEVVVNGEDWVRVKSCATNNLKDYEKIICGDEIADDTYHILDDNGEDNVAKYNNPKGEADISNTIRRYTAREDSKIGPGFSMSITEALTQAESKMV